jgi:uncharacterized protein YxjI
LTSTGTCFFGPKAISWTHQYVFTRSGAPVAKVSKQWFALGDTYGVQTAEGQDDVLILASTVVIDMVCHADGKK